jgi:hypothetical protein
MRGEANHQMSISKLVRIQAEPTLGASSVTLLGRADHELVPSDLADICIAYQQSGGESIPVGLIDLPNGMTRTEDRDAAE